MKKKITFLIAAAVMLLTMMASTGTMWGQSKTEVTITMSDQGWSNDQAIGEGTLMSDANNASIFDYTSGTGDDGASAGPKYFTNGTNVRFYAKKNGNGEGNWMQITVPANTTITGVELAAVSNYTPTVKYSVDGNSDVNWSPSSNKYTLTDISATSSFKFKNAQTGSTNTQLRITSIKITYTQSGGNPTCDNPTYSPAGGTYAEAQTVTISCATENSTIYYTTNGDIPTVTSSVYSTPLNISTTTTVKAIATAANYDNSNVATATYTIIPALTTMDEIFAAATDAGTTATPTLITCNNWIVTGVKSNNAYVTDGTKGFIIYQSGHGFAVGNILNGTVACNVQLYKGAAEITGLTSTTSGLTVTTGGSVTPVTNMPISTLSGVNTGAVFSYQNLTYNGTVLKDADDNEITPYNTFYTFSLETNHIYNVTGVFIQFNTTKELAPRDVNDIEEVTGDVATPTFSPAAGTYTNAQTVTISCQTQDVTIYYTTDCSDPDDESDEYTGPITISETTTVKAVAYDSHDNTSNIAVATFHINSQDNPYTVTQALSFYEYPANSIYVQGIVSTAPTQTPTTDGELTYYISVDGEAENQLEVYKGKNLDNSAFTEKDDIQVGDIVTVYGNVVIYGTTNPIKEFAQGNYIVEFERPVVPVINASDVNLAYNTTSGEIAYTIENPVQGVTLNANCEVDWISNIVVGEATVTFTTTVNESEEDRTATITLSYTGADNKEVTVTQGHYVVDYATLPFEFDGGKADIETTDGLTSSGNLGGDYGSSPKLKFSATGNCLILHFNEEPGALTFDIKGNGSGSTPWAGTFTVMASENGSEYTELVAYTELSSTTESKLINNIGANVRYIKWVYTEKTLGNVALGNIYLYEAGGGPVVEAYNLTVEPYENLEIFVFVEDENNPGLEEAGTIQVNEGDNVMLSVTANEGYVMQSLMVDGVEHVNDITEEATYTFQMPGHDVTINATAVEYVPFEPVTYTLATTVEPGKSYIIVGGKTVNEETTYYAMGLQNNNNRAAVGISVDGTTATVNTADVYEFVISTDETDNSLFNIYDAVNNGYLYAAGGTSSNYLKTKSTIEETGQWAIVIDQDGVASIVANFGDEKANTQPRNTMRFNSGNVPPIFSCYGADNTMNDVYLYVKDENPGFVTQTIELVEGWNWVSFYVEGDPFEMLTQLETSLGDKGLSIESQYYSTEFDGEEWFGELDFEAGLTCDLMYLINVTEDCTITLQGTQAVTETVEITINPGWNWIGFPSAVEIDVPVAMSGFDAEEEDTIENQQEGAEYDGEEWFGFETLIPGQGLLYFSNSNEVKTLVFRTGSKAKK